MPRRRSAPAIQPIPLARYLHRLGVRRWIAALIAIIIAVALVIADRQGWLISEASEWATYHGRTFRVVRVIDGDTLDIDRPDGRQPHTRVRFWGIDAPETAKPQEGKPAEPFADDAWAYTRQACESRSVRLRLDPRQARDRYGRLLAYLELESGEVLNEQLLLEGLAAYEPRFPHQLLERYQLLEKQAKVEKKGMWGRATR